MMGKRWIVLATLCAVATGSALAGPTGLNAMPTADVLGHRELYVNFGISGTERNISSSISKFGGMQAGLFDRIEFGYDNDFEGSSSANLKIAIFADKKLAVSAGVMNLGNSRNDKYVVAAMALNENSRIHAGWINDGSDRWMAGYDLALCENWTLMVDTISGADSYSYVGVNFVTPSLPGFDITLSCGIPHERSSGYVYSVSVGYGIRF